MKHLDPVQQEAVKAVGDVASIGIVVGALVDYLPAVAAGVTVVWTCIRIWETKTVQHLIDRYIRKTKGGTNEPRL